MKSIFRANLFILLLVVFQILSQLTIVGPLIDLMGYSKFLALDEYLFLLIPVILYMAITKLSPKEVFRLNKLSFSDAFIVIVIAVFCQPIASFLSYITAIFFSNPVSKAFHELSSISLLSMLFMMAVTPAICEEAVTRGVVLHGYNNKSIFKAALVNGLVFAILHLSPQQSLYAFALGFIFVYIVRITNSIFASMLCHFTFNSLQVTLSKLVITNTEASKAQGEAVTNQGGVQIIVTLIVLFAIAAVCGVVIYSLIKILESRHRTYPEQYTVNYQGDTDAISNSSDARAYLYNGYDRKDDKAGVSTYVPLILLTILYFGVMILISR